MIYFVLEKPFFTRFQNLRASNKKSFLDNQLSFLRTYTHTHTHTNKEVQNISGIKYSLTRKQIDYFYRMPADYSSHPITLFLWQVICQVEVISPNLVLSSMNIEIITSMQSYFYWWNYQCINCIYHINPNTKPV